MADLKIGEPYIDTCPNCDHTVESHPVVLPESPHYDKHCNQCTCPLTQDYVVRAIMICGVGLYEKDLKEEGT